MIGVQEQTKGENRSFNSELATKSSEQKHLRLEIKNCKDKSKKANLKEKRNKLQHEISKKALEIRNKEIDEQVEEINQAPVGSKMYKAVGALFRGRNENPKVEDESGKLATEPNEILSLTTEFFKDKFYKENAKTIKPFENYEAKALDSPITPEEVMTSFKKLNNNRVTGEDQIPGELLRYGPKKSAEYVAKTLNQVFETHQPLNINHGNMRLLQKPGKKKGPRKNLRPVTLLNTIRKSLSLITLERIREKVEDYLSCNQSGFRPFRSTADVVWAHRWYAAKAALCDINIHITGIDMSSAFDTIKRDLLMDILGRFLEEDELRLIQFLLSDTSISIKINGASRDMPFLSNIGTPQGDGLSPVLFIVYLEAALKEVRDLSDKESHVPTEVAYADDVDFVSMIKFKDTKQVQDVLHKYNLLVNEEKTEYTNIKREKKKEDEKWRKVKKVGSLIGDEEDMERRKALSTAALNKMHTVWIRKDKISQKRKMLLYKTLVKPVLLYNCGTWGVTAATEKKMDAFHRKQLKRVLNIKYPTIISNEKLYEISKEKPISQTMRASRWKLLGHILRRDQDIPASKAMIAYYQDLGRKGFRGRRRMTLPVVLNKDLKHEHASLETSRDLQELRNLAQDRGEWSALTSRVIEAGEADESDD